MHPQFPQYNCVITKDLLMQINPHHLYNIYIPIGTYILQF